jgi:hypothetical protein
MGFFTAIALQQEYSADLARFINSNLGQVLAVAIAATVTATLRKTASSAAIDRLARRQQADLARFAAARTPPDPALVLGRASDQLALITQRLGEGDARAVVGLNEVRIAANIASVQQLRAGSEGALRNACGRLLRTAARHFARSKPGMPPPPVLLALIDRTLRLTLDTPPRAGHGGELIGNDPATVGRRWLPCAAICSPTPPISFGARGMIPEYTAYGVLIASAPFTACVALAINIIIHRMLVALRFYRWVWHPILFDTSLFVLVWAFITFHPLPIPQGLLP